MTNQSGKDHSKVKHQRSLLKNILVVTIVFATTPLYSQISTDNQTMTTSTYTFGKVIELKMKETITIEDSLTLQLTYFTHKRPYVGGSTMATASIVATKNGIQGDIRLSVRGVEGKSAEEDGLSDSDRYSTQVWEGYEFQLKEFYYDKSLKIIVIRNNKATAE